MSRLKQMAPRLSVAPRKQAFAPDQAQGPVSVQDSAPWRGWYKLARWERTRQEVFLRDGYTCRMCGRTRPPKGNLVCDHVRPHRGDERLFWPTSNLQTLCKSPCHDQHKQAMEQESRSHHGVWD